MLHIQATDIRSAPSLVALFQATTKREAARTALRTSDGSRSLTWQEYGDEVAKVAAGLHGLGVAAQDTVAIMLTNRPEFNIIDAAAMHLGAAPFSIYNTSPPDAIAHIFSNAGCRVVVCEPQFLPQILAAKDGSSVEYVVCLDDSPAGVMTYAELLAAARPDFDFDASWQSVSQDDLATLCYTSGTTGASKGVELTHANLLANLGALVELGDVESDETVVSYLPDAHMVNRFMAHYAPMVWGFEVTTLTDTKQLVTTLPALRPSIFVAVPMLWYRLKAALETGIEQQSPVARKLATWALAQGLEHATLVNNGSPVPLRLRLSHAVADKLVLAKLRQRIGLDRAKFAVTGAAPLAPEAMAFVLGLGLPVCEAWGMTELAAMGTVNRPGEIRVGTVGRAVSGVELRVAEDGELLARGPNVMRGYRNDPVQTAEAIDDEGWMHTGDVGSIDDEGFVRILDRKKELIINSGGKNMSPANIENQLKMASPLIGSAVAIGDARPFVVALVTLEPEAAQAFAEKHDLDPRLDTLAAHPTLLATIDEAVARANENLSRVEQVKYVRVLPDTWEPGGDELTPTLKLRRKPISSRYEAEIESLYANARKPSSA